MGRTDGIELILVAYQALSPEEQEEAFQRIGERRLESLAVDESAMARHLRSLRRVAEHLGRRPNTTSYRTAWRELRDAGEEDVVSLAGICRFFGSFREAIEAYDVSAATSTRRIEARFAKRRLGKVKLYSDSMLRESLAACVKDNDGEVPSLATFLHWRRGQLALAEAQGEARHIPGAAAYRRRGGGSWPGALRHFGYEPEG